MSEQDARQLAWSLIERIANGETLLGGMRDAALRHADRLAEHGPVRVLALDPCPRCGGCVIASEAEAKCATGCGWSYRRAADPEPIASRRADR